jgi:hypothetical protein
MCWLLLSNEQSYYGELSSFDSENNTGKFRTHVEGSPVFEGRTFYYLSAYWQAYHVWMVADESRLWEELIFRASDAVSFTREGRDGKMLRGLRKAKPEDSQNPELQMVQNGWDHEHCELCNAHIDPGDSCYRDAEGAWVCQRCFRHYVQPHDLSFIDGI